MNRTIALLGTFAAVLAIDACGGDDDSDGSSDSGDDFVSQLNAACEAGTQTTIDANLELAYSTDPKDQTELSQRILEGREEVLATLEGLEAPEEDQATVDELIAVREELVAFAEERLKLAEKNDVEALTALGEKQEEASDEEDELSAELGATSCDDELPEEDAQAAEDTLTEFATTADSATSCNFEDGLVTEAFVVGGFGGVKECEAEQEFLTKNPDDLPKEIEVDEITGVDGMAATIEFEDVGGQFDGEPAQATIYNVDGNWQIFEIRPLEE